jgi:integrase
MAKISKRTVDAATASRKPVFLWDDRLAGFGLQVLPTGTKSFVFQYRTAEGRSRRATIAKVGSVTPDQARTLAEGMSRNVKDGGDPLSDKHAARDAITVADLLDKFTVSPRYLERASKPQANGIGSIERHLKPLLGKRHVERLEQDDIRRAFAAIRDGKTAQRIKTGPRGLARVTGGEGAARYACKLLRTAFGWAVEQRLIQRNPAAGIDFGADGERDAVLDADGYSRLFATLAKMETERRVRSAVADAVRIIAMTGARRGEIANLRWEHVDLKAGRIALPSRRHKTGRKTGKPRIIALPAAAQAIIARQPDGRDFVFMGAKGKGPVSLAKPWTAIRREAGLPPKDFGLHGLRHSMATLLAVGGAQAAELMTSLGHRQMSTTTRYLHFADTARAALAERAAAPALAAMYAAAGKPKAKVVAMRKTRR